MALVAAATVVAAGTTGAAETGGAGQAGQQESAHVSTQWLSAASDAELDGRRGPAVEGVSRSDWRQQTEQLAAAHQQLAQQAAAALAAQQAAAAAAAQAAAAAAAQAVYQAAVAGAVADPKGTGAAMAASRGWTGAQFSCLDSLWTRESGWDYQAQNASSGAYGIPQSLPAAKLATAGDDWRTNPATQITWGLDYITRSYGSPCGAWAHSRAYGWY